MEGTMEVAVTTGKRKMEWCEREIPQLGPGELQIKSGYVGVYGFDLRFYSEERLANWVPDGPLALGHESGGVVSATGEGVTGLEIGGRAALEPGVPYSHCENYLKRHYNLCRPVRFMAIPDEKDGVSSEYCIYTVGMTFKLPDNISTMEGGLMEPLAVGMHAYELSNIKLGETAVVLGAGCTGLVTLMSLRAQGVGETCVADVPSKRLEKVRELGATRAFNSRNEDIEEFVKTLPGGDMDQVYGCTENHTTTPRTYRLIKRAGKITPVGISLEPVLELDIATLNATEGTIYSVYRYRNLYPSAVSVVSKELISLKKIVSRTFDFKDIIEGVDYSLNHKDEVIKVVIRM